jgi:type I restriction enzyme S subunit
VEFLDHIRRPITASEREPGPYPYYGANGQQDSVAKYLFDEPLILLAEDGGHFDDPARGVAYGVTGKCWVNNHAHVLRPKPEFDFGFLKWHLADYDLGAFVNGTTRSKLTKASAERIPLVKPPLPEQRRIANILDQADAIRRKRRETIALTEELLRSAFLEMFGDPVTNPKRWAKNLLGDLLVLKSGDFLSAKQMDRTGHYPVYGGNGINGCHSMFMFDESVITIGRVGVYCGVVHRTEPKSWVTDNALYVASFSDGLRMTYLEHALRMANLNQYANQAAQPLISGSRVYPVSILVPPLAQQEQFERVVKLQMSVASACAGGLADAEKLFGSLVEHAFSQRLSSEPVALGSK